EQAFRPVPQENSLFVEQARKPVHKKLIDNGAISQMLPIVSGFETLNFTFRITDNICPKPAQKQS
ncbi:hypothetical protein, partial [Microcoleus sp. Pol12B4]|uniref:hypothetical protein n=1 Tax=Microcoleus sp. Pol12B4 TaxID=3055395 RepID=UPI002FD3E3D3